jgi:hypothetical protein
VRIAPELWKKLDALHRREGSTQRSIIERALARELNDPQPEGSHEHHAGATG